MKQSIVAGLAIGIITILAIRVWRPPYEGVLVNVTPIRIDPADSAASPTSTTNRAREAARALDAPIGPVNYDQVYLGDIVDQMRQKTRVNIIVQWPLLEESNIAHDAPVKLSANGLSARQILEQAMLYASKGIKPAMSIDDDGILTITKPKLNAEPVVRIYNIRDLILEAVKFNRLVRELAGKPAEETDPAGQSGGGGGGGGGLFGGRGGGGRGGGGGLFSGPSQDLPRGELPEDEAADPIIRIIKQNVMRGSWSNDAGMASIHYYGGKLIIRQIPDFHVEIEAVLKKLREKQP